jgi:hypothetical protein
MVNYWSTPNANRYSRRSLAWSMLNLFRAIRGAIIVYLEDRSTAGPGLSRANRAMPDGVSFVRPAARAASRPAAVPRSATGAAQDARNTRKIHKNRPVRSVPKRYPIFVILIVSP